jgi:hypothetical protein
VWLHLLCREADVLCRALIAASGPGGNNHQPASPAVQPQARPLRAAIAADFITFSSDMNGPQGGAVVLGCGGFGWQADPSAY